MTDTPRAEAKLPFMRRLIGEPGCFLFYGGLLLAILFAAASMSPVFLPIEGSWAAIGVGLVLFIVGTTLILRDLFVRTRPKNYVFELHPLGFGCLGLLCVFIVLIAVPNLIEARSPGGESAPIGALKTIGTAQTLFRETDKERDGNLDYGTLGELASAGLIDQILGSGTKSGYLFACTYAASTSEFLWYATASPAYPGATGHRYFATNHEGVTFYTTSAPFSLNSKDCTLPAGVNAVGR